MNQISHIAIPYSRALFELAVEMDQVGPIYQDILLVESICKSNRDFRMMLKSPIVLTSKKVSILKSIFESKISKITMTFLSIIARKKRESTIHDIALAFIELYKNYMGILPAYLKTAGPPTKAILEEVTNLLRNFTGKDVELTSGVDEELIGGFVLQWNDKQYDSSILRQIKEMKKKVSGSNT